MLKHHPVISRKKGSLLLLKHYEKNPKVVQSQLTPKQILTILQQGNERFLHDQAIHRDHHSDIQQTSEAQYPMAIVLGCIDSRVPIEIIFDLSFGNIFCVRLAGTVINNDVLASIEFGCDVVGAKLIVVLGHSRCGAIQSAYNDVKHGHITQLLAKIKPAIEVNHEHDPQNLVQEITKLNIAHSMIEIFNRSKILQKLIIAGKVGIVGAMYDVSSGEVEFSNYQSEIKEFKSIAPQQLIDAINDWYK
jgi:carbonic anhydrase